MPPRLPRLIGTLALAALAAPALAQTPPPPPDSSPPALPPPAAGPGRLRADPFGDATVLRSDAEAQAAARFAALDSDRDGKLTAAELRAARPERPGPRPEGRRVGRGPGDRGPGMGMARMLDGNGDGAISRDEFVAGTLRRFDMADADRDGRLTKPERAVAMEAMRARMEQRMMARMGQGMSPEMGPGMEGAGDGGPGGGD